MHKKHVSLLILIVAAIMAGTYSVTQQDIKDEFYAGQQTAENESLGIATQDCASPVKFTHHFTDIGTIDSIIPPVFRNSRGTMPTTLINIHEKVPLYMPAPGRLVQGSYHTEQGAEFYMWETDAGCGVTFVFDHVTEPVEKIRELFPSIPRNDSRTDFFGMQLEMKAGELVGYTTGTVNANNWNFATYDASERNYLWETGEFANFPKYFTQTCPFGYYDKQMAQAYEALFVFSFNDIKVEKNLCGN